jgi:heme A synthase
MFALIVIGSVVRTTGSGLACPDWPLCQGHLIPPFEFHVLIEWTHRLVALLVGVLLLSTCCSVWLRREARESLGGLAALALALYFVQALLGALTVWKLLSPSMVSSHLAVALLLFVTLLTLTLKARAAAGASRAARGPLPAGLAPLIGLTTVWTWLQAVLGGMVSSSHAGCVCPDWPTCQGRWFPPLQGLVGLQMMHRFSAYLLLGLAVTTALRARRAPDPRIARGGRIALLLVLAQVGLGIANVLLGTPVWLSALHLATAAGILATLTITFFHAARGAAALAHTIGADRIAVAAGAPGAGGAA